MQGCSKGLITLEVAEDAWEVVGWDWGGRGGCPHPWWGCCWKALSPPGSITNNAVGDELLIGLCGGHSEPAGAL